MVAPVIVALALAYGLSGFVLMLRAHRRAERLRTENAGLKAVQTRLEDETRGLARRLEASGRAALEAETGGPDFLERLGRELREPLSAVRGFAGLLADATDATPRGREAAKHLKAASDRLVAVLDRLQALTAAEGPAAAERLDPVLAMRLACAAASPAAAMAGVALVAPQPVAGLAIRANAERLDQLLSGLIDNALRHSPSGATVTAAVTADEAEVRLLIRDQGPGLDVARRAVIFRPFAEGGGAGLAVARRLARGMDGRLDIEETAEGATFVLTLPRLDGVARPGAPLKGVILHVSAQAAERVLMRRRLPELGPVSIHGATSGEEGLALARDLRPDAILVDADLPDMDLQAFHARLAADELTFGTPTVALSARPSTVGALLKPVEETQLVAALSAALSSGRAQQPPAAGLAA